MAVDSSIFKAYDIRGVYPSQLDEDAAYKIGRAFVVFLGCREVVVGRDARISSPKLFESLVKGITDQGADVVDIGLTTTPMFYFSIANYNHESGIMVTASHNPAKYNGLKLCRQKAVPIGGDSGMEDIKKLVEKGDFPEADRKGKVSKKDPLKNYAEKVLSFTENIKPMKIVADAGNGMAPIVFLELEKSLPIESTKMYFEIDCSFPNHEANPSKPETLDSLRKRVVQEKAELGVAFDGDADRIAFVDEKGEIIPNDLVTALMAGEFLQKRKAEKILFEVRSSWAVRDTILKNGGKPVLWKAGHALIKKKMKDENIMFGGEKSGHYFYRDFWFADSAMITFVRMLSILSKKGKSLSELLKPFRIYSDSGEMNFEVKDKDKVIEKVEESFSKEAKKVLHVDGLTVEFDDWWFNLRKSNTEPVIRLNLEAKTKERMDEMKQKITKIIEG